MAATAPGLSMTELRSKLHAHLKTNGTLRDLKTQLRSVLLSEVLNATSKTQTGNKAAPSDESLPIADAIVAQHLISTGRDFTRSIFSSEANRPEAGDFEELRRYLGLPATPGSILSEVIRVHSDRKSGSPMRNSIGVQATESSGHLDLEMKLAAIDADFSMKYRSHRDSTRLDYELQIAAFRASLESEMKDELSKKLVTFRSSELSQMRREEQQRFEAIMRHKQEEFAEMERTLKHRIDLERSRLEQRQQDLEVRAADMDSRTRACFQQLDDKDQQIHFLEQQLRESRSVTSRLRSELIRYEDIATQRLEELQQVRAREQRRIDDIRRIQTDNMLEQRVKSDELLELRSKANTDGRHFSRPIAAVSESKAISQPVEKRENIGAVDTEVVKVPDAQIGRMPAAIVKGKGIAAGVPEPTGPQVQVVVPVGQAVPHAMRAREELSPDRSTRQDSTFDSPSLDRTNIERPNDHLSQLSSIAPRQNQFAGVDSTHLTAAEDMSEMTDDSAKPSIDLAAVMQPVVTHEEERRIVLMSDEGNSWGALCVRFGEESRVHTLRAALVPLAGDEETSRTALVADEEQCYKELLWDHKQKKESLEARPTWNAAPQFGGTVVIQSDSDDDASDLLFKKGSDDDDESF